MARPGPTTTAAGTTRPAIATGALGLTLLFVAALLDAEPLYVPGLTFTFVAAGAVAWVLLGVAGLRVDHALGATRVVEDEPLDVRVDVRAGRLPLPTGRIEDPLLPAGAPLATGRRRTRVRIAVRFARRGLRTLEPPSVVVRDPFGLVARTVAGTGTREVLVLPRIEPVTLASGGGDGSGLGLARRRSAALAEVELDGIGPLRPGTPASRIHWPSIARLAEPQERRLHADGDRLPLVVLDPRAPATEAGEADLDAAVRAAGSLARHLARAGGCHVLLPGDRRPTVLDATLGGWPRLHARLALVTAGDPPPVAAVTSRLGPVVYVAARRLRRPPRALRHAPAGARVLVVPGRSGERRPLFSVAGCTGVEISRTAVLAGGPA